MALKDKLFTRMFSEEGTEQSQEKAKPMQPDKVLPLLQIGIAALVAAICIAPIAINVINQGGLK